MIVSFFGHSSFCEDDKYKNSVIDLLDSIIGGGSVEFFLGGYGGFDTFAYRCCTEYKRIHPSASLTFVTPYIDSARLREYSKHFDATLYPPLDHRSKKFAICHRNRYMIDCSDAVIFYVTHSWGGAYQAYEYAMKRGKKIYNIENFSKMS